MAQPVGHDGSMFTLEDVDLHADLKFLREHPEVLNKFATVHEPHLSPEADARLRPNDYLIVR